MADAELGQVAGDGGGVAKPEAGVQLQPVGGPPGTRRRDGPPLPHVLVAHACAPLQLPYYRHRPPWPVARDPPSSRTHSRPTPLAWPVDVIGYIPSPPANGHQPLGPGPLHFYGLAHSRGGNHGRLGGATPLGAAGRVCRTMIPIALWAVASACGRPPVLGRHRWQDRPQPQPARDAGDLAGGASAYWGRRRRGACLAAGRGAAPGPAAAPLLDMAAPGLPWPRR